MLVLATILEDYSINAYNEGIVITAIQNCLQFENADSTVVARLLRALQKVYSRSCPEKQERLFGTLKADLPEKTKLDPVVEHELRAFNQESA